MMGHAEALWGVLRVWGSRGKRRRAERGEGRRDHAVQK
jgi:hypothetical protein